MGFVVIEDFLLVKFCIFLLCLLSTLVLFVTDRGRGLLFLFDVVHDGEHSSVVGVPVHLFELVFIAEVDEVACVDRGTELRFNSAIDGVSDHPAELVVIVLEQLPVVRRHELVHVVAGELRLRLRGFY